MGFFSWITNEGRPIIGGKYEPVYLLVPKKFGGKNISDSCYDGYGNFGGYDAYDLVADWNKEFISESSIKKPNKEDYKGYIYDFEKDELRKEGKSEEEIAALEKERGEKVYESALYRYKMECARIKDFKVLSDKKMREKYGDDYKRNIGIDIACDDEDNYKLPYPLKFSFSDMKYEDASPAISDPEQGCSYCKTVSRWDKENKRFVRIPYDEYFKQRMEELKTNAQK